MFVVPDVVVVTIIVVVVTVDGHCRSVLVLSISLWVNISGPLPPYRYKRSVT